MKRTVTNGQYGKVKKNSLMLPAIVVILGLLVMMYPVVSTAWNNYGASKAAKEYAQLDKDTPQEVKNTQWDKAHEYNEQRTSGPILDPWLNDISSDNPEYAEYLDQLSENDAMARFIFPKIGVDLPLYHGTSDDVLQRGLGHLYGSDLPVGGRGTHSVITGHTGLSNATMFDNLSKAEEGDAFYVQVSGHKLKYEIDQIKVVLPNQTEGLTPDESGDYITLITCTPYGVNTHRLLVRGHQVPLEPVDEGVFDQNHSGGWQWWMYALMAAVLAIGAGFAWWARRQRKLSTAAASANGNSKGLSSGAQKQSDDNN
ncbi:class C sortase [Brevibacterium sp. HMSC24B04]|uniref:class C sortase n=1 Tax=Brevibacterium sp. HMSC24B04 TaxID=1581060 RepID=UPI0008A37543|nr:class C sortase [Brevibacterium sp. HMSC24B04]OFT92462.1 class C sortase [Brevibacterium sp. HMSC24B04]